FKVLNEKKPWEGEYHFDLLVRENTPKTPEGQEQAPEGVFRLIVFVNSLQKEEGKLSAEEREARKRLLALREQASNVPPEKLRQSLDEKMREEVAHVSPAQMERFVADQLSALGALEAKEVKLESDDPREVRFAVTTAPRAETFRTWPHDVTYGF